MSYLTYQGKFIQSEGHYTSRITPVIPPFDTSNGFNGIVLSVAAAPDGKVYAGGVFATYRGTNQPYLVRLNSNGTLDTTFDPSVSSNVWALYINPSGKLYAGGAFQLAKNITQRRLAKFNSNGSVDYSFDVSTRITDGQVTGIVESADGKVYVGGNFTTVDGSSRKYLSAFNSNGTLDTSLSIGTGFNATSPTGIWPLITSDGKIFAPGRYETYKNLSQDSIALLYPSGVLDTSFDVSTSLGLYNTVYARAYDSVNNKYYIGGTIYSFNGTTIGRMARLNSNGSLDTSFDMSTGFNGDVYSIILDIPNSKVYVAGFFTTYRGATQNRIARLNISDGTLDNTFNIGTGFNDGVRSISLDPDGNLYCGGNFTTYQGVTANRIIKLSSTGSRI